MSTIRRQTLGGWKGIYNRRPCRNGEGQRKNAYNTGEMCEVCELLSRDTSNKESEIISRPWDAVTARTLALVKIGGEGMIPRSLS